MKPARRFCRTCGAEIVGTIRFCGSCGAALNTTSPYPAPPAPTTPVTSASVPPPAPPTVVAAPPTVGSSVKMGFGFALGMLLFWVMLGAIALVAIGLAAGALTWPFAGPAGQRFEGRGSAESTPIELGGPTRVEWTAGPTSPAACPLNADLRREADRTTVALLVSTSIPYASPPVGNTIELSLPAGRYVVRVESGCEWSFRFVPSQ